MVDGPRSDSDLLTLEPPQGGAAAWLTCVSTVPSGHRYKWRLVDHCRTTHTRCKTCGHEWRANPSRATLSTKARSVGIRWSPCMRRTQWAASVAWMPADVTNSG